MKKLVSLALAVLLTAGATASLASCGGSKMVDEGFEGVTLATDYHKAADYSYLDGVDFEGQTLNVGAIWVGDRTEGYTRAHDDGIKAAEALIEEKTHATINIEYNLSVPEDTNDCETYLNELADSGKTLIFTNSYGHQFCYGSGENAVQAKYPNVTFVSLTGDQAATSGYTNYKNAFTSVYQSRFVSGVIAGLKLQQLDADGLIGAKNKDANGKVKIGYVGAFNYAEVVSGYTAFFLGIQSVYPNVSMTVQYTDSWYDYDAENETAKALIADGCIIIGQHADSEGAPSACEAAYKKGTRVYSVGYNVDMLEAAPHAALTSATNVWQAYYTHALFTALNGGTIETDWTAGYAGGAVDITEINGKAFKEDPSARIKAIVDSLADGTLKVFDCSKFTVNGAHLTTYTGAYGMRDQEALRTEGSVTYFNESVLRSAPYFDIRIDGITELAKK